MLQLMPQHILSLFQGAKVLVVDDEFYSRKVVRTLLLGMGITNIYDADSGAKGLDAIRAIAPDVVLVDWEMPVMDGAAFSKAVRTPGFAHPNVPIIMLTGHSERWRVKEAMRLGVNGYLLKPVSGQMLCDRLVSTLTKPRSSARIVEKRLG
jgi:YesN/AraC family two-component response regulator